MSLEEFCELIERKKEREKEHVAFQIDSDLATFVE